MRLDMFLKTSRLVKRRSVAKELCDKGRAKVGGQSAKAGREVKEGDVLSLNLSRRKVVAEIVLIPPGNVSKERAAELYKIIEDTRQEEEI